MKQIVVLAIIVVVGVVIVKLRSDAARQRKAVLARLATEVPTSPDESPTALLFREVGAPVPGESDASVSGSGQEP